jgi:hypothetical protein
LVFFHFLRIWVNVDFRNLWCINLCIIVFSLLLKLNLSTWSAANWPSEIQYHNLC